MNEGSVGLCSSMISSEIENFSGYQLGIMICRYLFQGAPAPSILRYKLRITSDLFPYPRPLSPHAEVFQTVLQPHSVATLHAPSWGVPNNHGTAQEHRERYNEYR